MCSTVSLTFRWSSTAIRSRLAFKAVLSVPYLPAARSGSCQAFRKQNQRPLWPIGSAPHLQSETYVGIRSLSTSEAGACACTHAFFCEKKAGGISTRSLLSKGKLNAESVPTAMRCSTVFANLLQVTDTDWTAAHEGEPYFAVQKLHDKTVSACEQGCLLRYEIPSGVQAHAESRTQETVQAEEA